MKLIAEVVIDTINAEVPWKIQHKVDKLRYRLKKYRVNSKSHIIKYVMECDTALYNEIITLEKEFPQEVVVKVDFKPYYIQEELEKAVAFIPKFQSIHLGEYGDDNYTHEYFCNTCANQKIRHKLIVNPDGKTKELLNSYNVVKCGEEISVIYGVSVPLYIFLIQSSIKENDFIEINSKRSRAPFAFAFYGNGEVQLVNKAYIYRKKCIECGTIYAEQREENSTSFYEFGVTMRPKFADNDIFFSTQYFDGEQKILVSPRLYKLIKEKCPKAEFEPVFLQD